MNTYAFTVRGRNGWGVGFGPEPTHCHQCGAAIVKPGGGGVGYACGPAEPIDAHPDAPALRKGRRLERAPAICYSCCAVNDRASMMQTGRAVLYLAPRIVGTARADAPGPLAPLMAERADYAITNWPGSLSFACGRVIHRRNAGGFGASRIDTWFIGPDGFIWHAVNRGDNQIARCRRTKERAPA